jgi:uncharacterized protein (UPF0548 family)
MFSLSEPTEQRIRSTLARQRELGFSYSEVGASRSGAPRNYNYERNRICLGHGSATFARAVKALQSWQMFEFPDVRLCWPSTHIQAGNDVVLVAKHCGIWSLNCCRIVYVVDEVERYAFAYGTLQEHSFRGEERFTVEWDRLSSDSVSYEVRSFSRASDIFVRVGYPVARLLQRRFARESFAAMVRGVENL